MLFDSIPKEIKIDGKKVNLHEEDLARGATFVSVYGGHKLFLQPKQERENTATKQIEPVENTAVRLVFEAFKKTLRNSHLVKMVMETQAFKVGDVAIDKEDPTGFWRAVGALEVQTMPVVISTKVQIPDAEKLDFTKVEPPKKDEVIQPVRVVSV
jgi:hypothetical protein